MRIEHYDKNGLVSVEELPSLPPTPDDVRRECERRMMLLVNARSPEHLDLIVKNGTREAVRLLRKGEANWSDEERARSSVLEQIDAAIEHLRSKSNEMELSLPSDYASDARWG